MTRVTAVVPVWNQWHRTSDLLASIAAQEHPFYRVVVVDNGSSDGSAEAAKAWGACVIRFPVNRGFAPAVNAGVGACDSEFVAILNNDVRLEPNWLRLLLDAFAKSDVHFACGKLLREDGLIDGAYDLISRSLLPWRAGHGRADGALWNVAKPIDFASFTALVLRRELFETVGRLDEEFESYYEDVDWMLRCSKHAARGFYQPAAVGVHTGSATAGEIDGYAIERQTRNHRRLLAKHYSSAERSRLSLLIGAAKILWAMSCIRRGEAAAWWRGLRSGTLPSPIAADGLDLSASEVELLRLQRVTGMDFFWRCYYFFSWLSWHV